MSNSARLPAKSIEGRSFSDPIILRGGVDQETSPFAVAPGTLYDCLNYVAGPSGYESLAAPLRYDGALDIVPSDMLLLVAAKTLVPVTGTRFTLGGSVTWLDDTHSGTVAFWDDSTDYWYLGIIDIDGDTNPGGVSDVITDAETGTTLTFPASPANPTPALPLRDAVDPAYSGAAYIGDVYDYGLFLGSMASDLQTRSGVTIQYPYNAYKGAVPGYGPILGGWQYNDSVYVVRNTLSVPFTAGGTNGGTPIRPGDIIQIPYYVSGAINGWEYVRVFAVTETQTFWEQDTMEGTLIVGPSRGNAATTYRSTANYVYMVPDYLDDGTGASADIKDTAGNVLAQVEPAASATLSPQTAGPYGLPWKATPLGWTFVNTGWSLPFHSGAKAPGVANAPLFQNDVIDLSDETSAVIAASGGQTSSADPFTDWTNVANITADDGSYATCNLPDTWTSERLIAYFSLASHLDEYNIEITGIELTVQARQTGTGTPHDSLVRITGPSLGPITSHNKASSTALTGAALNYVYGGPGDLWGMESIDPLALITASPIGFRAEIQYTNESGNAGQVEVDYVSVKVYYRTKKFRAYFYNTATASDICAADIISYQQTAGDFSIDTAEGTFTIAAPVLEANNYESSFGLITGGIQIRTAASGGGDLIAIASNQPSYNLLPGSDAMEAAESMYQVIGANFFENEETFSIYGATGAGPAFAYNDEGFFFIRTPLTAEADKPRHVAFHDNKLALGFGPGFVALSAPGVPNDFTGVTGADPSLWGVGDTLTGLVSLPGNVLGVFSESSIRTLEGSGEETGTMRVISANSGAKEYTTVLVGEPVFADNRGVSSLSTTDKYGDFSLGRLTDPIRSWVQRRLQRQSGKSGRADGVIAAVPVRNKNQYRLFFEDGYGLCLYFSEDGSVEPTFFHYETHALTENAPDGPTTSLLRPSWLDSSVLSTGRERIVMGTEDGEVFVLDASPYTVVGSDNALTGTIDRWLILNPLSPAGAEIINKSVYASVQGRYWGYLPVYSWADTNYHYDRAANDAPDVTSLAGALTDSYDFTKKPFIVRPYLSTLTDGLMLRLGTTALSDAGAGSASGVDRLLPHSFQSVILRSSTTAANRTRASKEY